MKNIFGIVFALLATFNFSFAQTAKNLTDLEAQNVVIRDETVPGANTKLRIYNMYKSGYLSSPNIFASYSNPSWLTDLPWSKITGTPSFISSWPANASGALTNNGSGALSWQNYWNDASTNTNMGLKTFLDGTLGMRNVANTFTSQFTNTNSAARTYPLPDFDGTVLAAGGTNTLTGDTFINSNGFQFDISAGSFGTLNVLDNGGTNRRVTINGQDGSGSFGISSGISSTYGNGLKIFDLRSTKKGIEYSADYSATYTTRSLVDRNYSDTRLNGLTFTNSPSTNNVPTFNGTNWTFQTPSGGSFTVASLAEAQAGTNNVNGMTPLRVRQVSKKVFNVEAYGAVHDGVLDANGLVSGTDDTAAIQAAINACFAAGGGTVYFPNGVYVISGSLVTSIDGVNPNGQLIIPLTGPFTGVPAPYVKIIFQGESNGSLADGMIGLRGRNTKGVLLYSTITGSGTTPSVISASFDAVSYGFNLNQTEVAFKNIEVRVKSMSGASHQAATMSAINLSYIGSAQVYDCFVSIQSPIFTSASQVSAGTYGFIAPIVNNSGNIVFHNTQASGFSVGYLISEHFVGDQIWATGCATGLQVGAGNHVARISRYFSNGCRYAIDYLAQCPVQIEQFGFERSSHSAWYDAVFDVNNSANSKGVVYYYGFVQGSASDQTITLDGLDAPADFVKINRIHQSFGGGGYAKGNLKQADYPDSPWLEQNASGDGNFAVFAQTAQQSGTSNLVAIQTVINKQTATGENRLWESRVITNGATNTGLKRESIVTAGAYATATELSGTLYGVNVPTVIGGTTITNASTILDLQSTSKALILPRVTNTAAITTPVNGMKIYDVALNKERTYENGAWVNTIGGGGSALSSLTAATASNSIDNANNNQTWNWNSLSNTGLNLFANSTEAASNSQILLAVDLQGANVTSGQFTRAASFSNVHTGTSSTNVAGWFNAAGGTINNAIYINGGDISLNGSSGTSGQVLTSAGANAVPTWTSALTNPMTTVGDVIVGGASGAATRLGIGANTFVLTSNGTTATWAPSAGGGSVSTVSATVPNRLSVSVSNPTSTPSIAITNSGIQTITTGTATTLTSYRALVNPASLLASHTITMPASPADGDIVDIDFAGTIAVGSEAVTTFSIVANAGQSINHSGITPTNALGGSSYTYVYYTSITTWKRKL